MRNIHKLFCIHLKTAIRCSDTRYFVDPSIAVAALGIGPSDLIDDLKTFGFLLETLCIRDLRVFVDSIGGEVYHYRDKSGLECDAVVHLRNGQYGLIYAYRRPDGICVVPIGCLKD